jgi:hypothetical protein
MMAGVPKRDHPLAAQRLWLEGVLCAQAENVSPGFNTAPKKPPLHLQKPTLNATQLHSVTFNNNTTCLMIIPHILPPRAARVTLALQGDKTTHTHPFRRLSLLLGRKTSILKLLPLKYNTTTITLSMTT